MAVACAETTCPAPSPFGPLLQSISLGEDLDRMGRMIDLQAAVGELLSALHHMLAGERTFGGDIGLALLGGGARHRPADLERRREILLADAPGAAVAGAALDHVDVGV